MGDKITFGSRAYVSASEAARLHKYTRDYVALLCRRGDVPARKLGNHWYVDEGSLAEFVRKQHEGKAVRRENLSIERKNQYHARNPQKRASLNLSARASKIHHKAHQQLARITNELADAGKQRQLEMIARGAPGIVASPTSDLLHRVSALITAILITFGLYAFIHPAASKMALDSIRATIEVSAKVAALAFDESRSSAAAVEYSLVKLAENPTEYVSRVNERVFDWVRGLLQDVQNSIKQFVSRSYRHVEPDSFIDSF